MSKRFYAAYHAYDIKFCNDYCTLFRFATKAERDAYVEDANYDESGRYGSYRTEAVTRAEARRHFPNAFKLFDTHGEADERDWHEAYSKTSAYWSTSNFYEW